METIKFPQGERRLRAVVEPEVVRDPRVMQRLADSWRAQGLRIACVPTMGDFHEGHLSLMREARRWGDVVVTTLFVNPIQFNDPKDFEKYARNEERDLRLAGENEVDVLFCPDASAMYPGERLTTVSVSGVTDGLCGAGRPGHFDGVATVVTKLFNIVKPHVAVFGEKDFQQLMTVRRMVADLNLDVDIVGMPCVREADGLAMSSRNRRLSEVERQQALAISRGLFAARNAAAAGEADATALIACARAEIEREGALEIEYLEVRGSNTLEPVKRLGREPVRMLVAAHLGEVRLIDNLELTRS